MKPIQWTKGMGAVNEFVVSTQKAHCHAAGEQY